MLEDVDKEDPEVAGAVVVGSKKDAVAKREEPETNGDTIQSIQVTTITTKSGRASKPSTPAIPQFPDPPARSRSSRNTLEASNNKEKRSHKKGAGAAAQLIAQQNQEVDDAGSTAQEDEDEEEIGADEPLYCYCNGVSYGEMVACDADDCEKEWFHLECVGLKVPPKSSGKLPIPPLLGGAIANEIVLQSSGSATIAKKRRRRSVLMAGNNEFKLRYTEREWKWTGYWRGVFWRLGERDTYFSWRPWEFGPGYINAGTFELLQNGVGPFFPRGSGALIEKNCAYLTSGTYNEWEWKWNDDI